MIINASCLDKNLLAEESVDLVVTSPPYNLDIQYEKNNDDLEYNDYLTFSRNWLANVYHWLRPDGRLCLNVPLDTNKGGQRSVGADITTLAKQLGYKYQSTIIWNETNISKRTAWGSWLSASAPYVIAPVELIIVLYKASWKKLAKGQSDIERQEFLDWTNGVWTFNGERKKLHPAPFPLELPTRCIKMFSYRDTTVLDPFLGSGTTLLACKQLSRNGIGIDISTEYCKIAESRISL